MKKTIIIATVVTIVILAVSSGALALGSGSGFGADRHDQCLMDILDDGQKAQFEEIISEYREKMSALRKEIDDLREKGKYDDFKEVHESRHTLMEEMRESIRNIIPDEYAERFESGGRNLRHYGLDKGSGGFKSRYREENGL